MELYLNVVPCIECARKHGEKYPAEALTSLKLLHGYAAHSHINLSELCWPAEAEASDSVDSDVEADLLKEKAKLRNNSKRSAWSGYKYAVHLLHRIYISPLDGRNDAMVDVVDYVCKCLEEARDDNYVRERLEKASAENGGEPDNIDELLKRAREIKLLLEWWLPKDADDDLFAVINCQSFLMFRMLSDGISPSILMDYWRSISPDVYQNASDKVMRTYRATLESLSEIGMDANETDYVDEQLKACEIILMNTKKLASIESYTPHLRTTMAWVRKIAIQATLEASYPGARNKAERQALTEKACRILSMLYDEVIPCPYVTVEMDKALEIYGFGVAV